jgi:hypothetical protein
MRKRAKLDPNSPQFHVICPFCHKPTDYRTQLRWCGHCYTQFTVSRSRNVWFDDQLKRPEYALPIAVMKAGGIRMAHVSYTAEAGQER